MKNVHKVMNKPKGRPITLNESEEAALYKFLQYDFRDNDYSREEVNEFVVSMQRIKGLLIEKFL